MKNSTFMMIAASVLLSSFANAQSWNLAGNTNLTNTSKIGGTSATSAQNFPLRFYTYNAQRMHINANVSGKVGYVGIGTTAPAQRLHVSGNGLFTGNLGIGITSPTQKLHVAGNGLFTGTLTAVGISSTTTGNAVYANSTGGGYGVWGTSSYLGVYGSGNSYGVYGASNTYGVYGNSSNIGVYGYGGADGIYGESSTGYGVYGVSATTGIYGSGGAQGVIGASTNGMGVYGSSTNSFGVYGDSYGWQGGRFESINNNGIWAKTYSSNASVYAGVFEGNVYSYGVYVGSDRQLKKNITDVENAMSIISRLKPKNYEFRDDGVFANMNLPKGNHYGFIAQEVEEIVPQIVALAPEGLGATALNTGTGKPGEKEIASISRESNVPATKAVNYTELIPIIIKAMQEQQQEIKELKEQLAALNTSTNNMQEKAVPGNYEQVKLEQNVPNPFTGQTVIRYYLPEGTDAVLKVMSSDGKEVYSTPVTKSGYGETTISAKTLAAGTYSYTLIVNGKAVESRMMILSE